MAQWSPALILLLPVAFALYTARRPGPVKLVLALLVTVLLDAVTAFAFWLQPQWRSAGDTVRLIVFLALPAAVVTGATLFALKKGLARAQPARKA